MPLIRFTAKAYHNGQYMEPGAVCVVDDAELGPHMDPITPEAQPEPEQPITILADVPGLPPIDAASEAAPQETIPGDA